jgi:hypothetical protein
VKYTGIINSIVFIFRHILSSLKNIPLKKQGDIIYGCKKAKGVQ